MNHLYTRVSIRKYQDRPVEKEKTEAILRAAMQAPSAGNQQPWEFYVVTNKEKLAPHEERMLAVEKILSIPDNLRAFAIFPYGYPAEERKQQNRFEESRIHYME